MAAACDLTVVVIGGYGIRSDWGLRTYGESADRPSVDFYGRQTELVRALVEAGRPVVAVIINGKPLNNEWITAHVPASSTRGNRVCTADRLWRKFSLAK